jgi:preprotein translocase subunit SecG
VSFHTAGTLKQIVKITTTKIIIIIIIIIITIILIIIIVIIILQREKKESKPAGCGSSTVDSVKGSARNEWTKN